MSSEIWMVRWIDALTTVGWEEPDWKPDRADLSCVSVGVIVHEDEETLTLAATWGEEREGHNCRITVPKLWVVSRSPLVERPSPHPGE